MQIDHLFTTQIPEETLNVDLFKEKLFASWGSARDQFGVPNNHRLAKLLYKSLYAPNTLSNDEIVDNREFGRVGTLTKKMPLNIKDTPDEKEFITVVVRALTSDINFSKNLYPEALETIEKMIQYGPVRIWTRGDVYGVDKYPGSVEQIKKVAPAGLGKLRNSIAPRTKNGRQDILSIKAAEDKIPFIKGILEEFKDKKIKVAILLDDQIDNIKKALKEGLKVQDIHIYPVWIHQKKEGAKEGEITTVGRIKDVLGNVEDITKENKVGFIVDFDGVIVDDNKRMQAQLESVYNKLKEKKWL